MGFSDILICIKCSVIFYLQTHDMEVNPEIAAAMSKVCSCSISNSAIREAYLSSEAYI